MLKQGDIVKLYDGSIGEVVWANEEGMRVLLGDLTGDERGPWDMAQEFGQLASDEERAAYVARVNS